MKTRPEAAVVLVGLLGGLVIAVAPDGAIPIVALAAAAIAGVIMSDRPMYAAVLVLAPTIALAVVRTALDSDRNVGAVVMALVSAVVVAAIVTHVAAGIALRRADARSASER